MLCLACETVGCGRDQAAHALSHHQRTKHPLVIDVHSGQVWCYPCDDFVLQLADDNTVSEEFVNESTLDISGELKAVGLSNLGNSCYMNAAIQALLCVPALVAYYSAAYNDMGELGKVYSQLIQDLYEMDTGEHVTPHRFVRAMKALNPQFHGYSQQDTMDFTRTLLDRLHEEEGNDSFIRALFGGRLESKVECVDCGHVSFKIDPLIDLCCPIPSFKEASYVGSLFNQLGETLGVHKQVKLETCLEAFFATEILDGSDRVKCDRCKRLTPAKKSLRIEEYPECLLIQLKRFRHDSFFSSKINTAVAIPEQIFLQGNAYELVSLINHRGTLGGGHYVAYGIRAERWWEFDDSRIRSGDDWERQQAYAVIYVRSKRKRQRELNEWLPLLGLGTGSAWVPRTWLVKWRHFGKPPPLDYDLCEHGGVRLGNSSQLVEVPELFAQRYSSFTLRDNAECKDCQKQAVELERRRQQEAADIMEMDSNYLPAGDVWHLIHAGWIGEWTGWKEGRRSQPPGSIPNHEFMDGEGRILPGLTRGIHYRGVNGRVWEYFHGIYGGGPKLIAPSIDIYQSTVRSPSKRRNKS